MRCGCYAAVDSRTTDENRAEPVYDAAMGEALIVLWRRRTVFAESG